MAKVAPSEEVRNANLDALKAAVDDWANSEKERLENENQFLRAVLKGRNATNTGTKNLVTTASLVQESIGEFIGVV